MNGTSKAARLRHPSARMLLFSGIAVLLAVLTTGAASAATLTASRSSRNLTATATHFTITGPTATTADTGQSFVVTALDGTGATVTGYTGTVHFTSTDAHASLPANYTFVGGDSGVHTFAGVKLESLGSKTITVNDTTTASIKGTTAAIAVTAGAAKTLSVAIPTASTVGGTVSVKVTALDGGGNVATGYTGTVYFTSSDANADLPDDYTFVAGDKGVHTFTATMETAGSKTITAKDTTTSSITGTSAADVVAAGTVTHLGVTESGTVVAGSAGSVTVNALNASNGIVVGYTGTVHFTSTDAGATLPADYTFVGGDHGSHTFSVTLDKAGSTTVSAKDTTTASITGSVKVAVMQTDAATLAVSIPTASTAGQPVVVKVTALDPGGNVDPDYTGTVTFTSSDASADLPNDYTFLASDRGVHTFRATLVTAGSKTVTATDTTTGSITGTSAADVVAAGVVTHLGVTGPSSAAANASITVTVKALNAFNTVVAGYTGIVHFTTTDQGKGHAVTLPADYTFLAGDHGVKAFAGVKLESNGNQTIKVADTVKSAIAGSLLVKVGANSASALVVSIPAKSVAGEILPLVTVTAVDPGGNIDTGYTGTIHFTSSDSAAILPADYTFTGNDNGRHTFTAVRLMTAGNKTVTATDTTTGSITGTSSADAVATGTVTHLSVTGTTTKVADASNTLTVTALNAFDAKVTGYTGTVHFTSSDGNTFNAITLPANYTFVSGDNGSHAFAGVKLETAGTQTVTATDTASKVITGTRVFTITVGAAKTLTVSAPKAVVDTVAFNVTVTAVDAGGNTVPGYTGAVTFTSTDGSATLPADYTYVGGDNGKHVFSVTLATAGNKTVTATDKTTGSITGTSAAIKVH
jgi:hypothetical protein